MQRDDVECSGEMTLWWQKYSVEEAPWNVESRHDGASVLATRRTTTRIAQESAARQSAVSVEKSPAKR